jgi:uncharacterized protein
MADLPTAKEILDRFYAAERVYMSAPPAEADFSGMGATLSPQIKLYQSPDLPYGGEYEGHEGEAGNVLNMLFPSGFMAS